MSRKTHTAISTQKGFTIVELLIATAIFSMVLLVAASAIVYVGRMYYKGTITNRTQDTSRVVIDDISKTVQYGVGIDDPLQFGRKTPAPTNFAGTDVWARCIGGVRYSYALDKARGADIPHVLWKDRLAGFDAPCVPVDITSASLTGGQELLGINMRIPQFELDYVSGLWTISVRIAYGEDPTVFTDGTYSACNSALAGGQFCAVAGYENLNVTKRL